MNEDYRKNAVRQYIHYFRAGFITIGVLLCVLLVVAIKSAATSQEYRQNMEAPTERVYDYANVLTDKEEEKLRKLIQKREQQIQCDIVLVTINETMEGNGSSWEINMRDYADDFYDDLNYGFETAQGSGVLLLDNWYKGQQGSHLSTCGKVYQYFGNREIKGVLDAVDKYVVNSPYKAYKAYIEEVYYEMGGNRLQKVILWLMLILPISVSAIFVVTRLRQTEAKSVSVNTYVTGGKPVIRESKDQFIRKSVSAVKIPRNTGGSSSGGSRGGGGGHVSRSGTSHGGGSRRR